MANRLDSTKIEASVEGQDCLIYAPIEYLEDLSAWYEDLGPDKQEECPSWFADLMYTLSEGDY